MTTTKTKTLWTTHRSIFQADSDLSLKCLNGSPAVSASPPQPQTQLQYRYESGETLSYELKQTLTTAANSSGQAMENIKASLESYGSSLGEVVKCTVFLADIGEWEAMNEVYVTYFPVNPPARSALGASGLALGARVEIECLAALR